MTSSIFSIRENIEIQIARNNLFRNYEKMPNFSLDFPWLVNAFQESTKATAM